MNKAGRALSSLASRQRQHSDGRGDDNDDDDGYGNEMRRVKMECHDN